MAIKNPFKWAHAAWQNRPRRSGNVVPFPNQQGQGVLPVGSNGQIVSPHEFLQAQIVNLPDEEESVQKRILVGERIHQGIRSGGDAAFVFTFGPFVLLANTGTAMLQVFLFGWHNASVASIASLVLWFRAFLPLMIVIGTIGVVAGIQRRSIRRMIHALNRKAGALTSVAQASVHFLEADMNARRSFNEMQALMRAAFDKMMERLSRLDDDDRNGRRMRL